MQKQVSCDVDNGHSGIEIWFGFGVKLVPAQCGRDAKDKLSPDKDSQPHMEKSVAGRWRALGMEILSCAAQFKERGHYSGL